MDPALPVLVPDTAFNDPIPTVKEIAGAFPPPPAPEKARFLGELGAPPNPAGHDFFVYDSDVDPEPTVRVVRLGIIGSILRPLARGVAAD